MIKSTSRKTALITGASLGIGLEFARLAADDGYNLVLVARDEKKLMDVAQELATRYGVNVRIFARDLSDVAGCDEIVAELEKTGISISLLINNAGYGLYGAFSDASLNDTLSMMRLNMLSLTSLTRLLLPSMLSRGDGKILNIASVAAFMPGPNMAVYYASKAYVLSFSEALSSEVRGTGVTVTALCPGPTQTGFEKRAGLGGSRLFKGSLATAHDVAVLGYKGVMTGKRLVIAGTQNRLFTTLVRILPRALVLFLVARMQASSVS